MVAFGEYVEDGTASAMKARDYKDATDLVAQPVTQWGEVAGSLTARHDSSPCADRGQNIVAQPIGFNTRQDPDAWQDRTGPVDTHYGTQGVAQPVAYAFKPGQSEAAGGPFVTEGYAPTLQAVNNGSTAVPAIATAAARPVGVDIDNTNVTGDCAGNILAGAQARTNKGMGVMTAMQVRRLTPTECERLQGFPDDWTAIPWRNKPESPDGPRYKALGNSMAVPCMRYLGERINLVAQMQQ